MSTHHCDEDCAARHSTHFQSRVLFKTANYVACVTRAGVSVQSRISGKGKVMPASHPQYRDWLEALDGAADEKERTDLSRAFLEP